MAGQMHKGAVAQGTAPPRPNLPQRGHCGSGPGVGR